MSLVNKEYDYLFKLVIVGNSGVGKSSLLNRFADDNFADAYLATIGVDFKFKSIQVENKKIKLQIWDTAGQERFRTITNAYYKGADAIIMVYDITNQSSFDDISSFWLNEAESYGERDSMIMLIGNKSDMENRVVSFEKAKSIYANKDVLFYETSAKTAECVETAFQSISKKLLEKKEKQIAQRKKDHQEKKKKLKEGENNGLCSLNSKRMSENTEEDKPITLIQQDEKHKKIKESLKNVTCPC